MRWSRRRPYCKRKTTKQLPASCSRGRGILPDAVDGCPIAFTTAERMVGSDPGSLGSHLENRVAGLLNLRRCLMTRLRSARIVLIAIGFIAVQGFSVASQRRPRRSRIRRTNSRPAWVLNWGRPISRAEMESPSMPFAELLTRLVSATCINSRIPTSWRRRSQPCWHFPLPPTGSHSSASTPNLRPPKMTVGNGEGHFNMGEDGSPHVSFYPVPSGDSFAGVYFGTANSTFRSPRKNRTDRIGSMPHSRVLIFPLRLFLDER